MWRHIRRVGLFRPPFSCDDLCDPTLASCKLTETESEAAVIAVCLDDKHAFSKKLKASIRLLEGLGVEGDAHMGRTVQHRSRVKANPDQPNLRQVHLIPREMFEEMGAKGFLIRPGDMGENITTTGIDLLSLPGGTVLHIGGQAEVEITGLRNPCAQIEEWQKGLLKENGLQGQAWRTGAQGRSHGHRPQGRRGEAG